MNNNNYPLACHAMITLVCAIIFKISSTKEICELFLTSCRILYLAWNDAYHIKSGRNKLSFMCMCIPLPTTEIDLREILHIKFAKLRT